MSVYTECRTQISHTITAKSLTGFGPVATAADFTKADKVRVVLVIERNQQLVSDFFESGTLPPPPPHLHFTGYKGKYFFLCCLKRTWKIGDHTLGCQVIT